MPIYTNDPCDDGFFPVEPSLRSSIGIGPKVTKAIDEATRDWLDDHPEATTTVEDNSLTNAKFMDGSVNSRVIENESITTDDIADLAVTTPKIADNAVDANKIASAAADGLRTMSTMQPGVAKVGAGLAMNNGALELDGSGDIATAVTAWLNAHPEATTTVVDGSITTPKLANDTVTDVKLAQSGGVLERVNSISDDSNIAAITNDTLAYYDTTNLSAAVEDGVITLTRLNVANPLAGLVFDGLTVGKEYNFSLKIVGDLLGVPNVYRSVNSSGTFSTFIDDMTAGDNGIYTLTFTAPTTSFAVKINVKYTATTVTISEPLLYTGSRWMIDNDAVVGLDLTNLDDVVAAKISAIYGLSDLELPAFQLGYISKTTGNIVNAELYECTANYIPLVIGNIRRTLKYKVNLGYSAALAVYDSSMQLMYTIYGPESSTAVIEGEITDGYYVRLTRSVNTSASRSFSIGSLMLLTTSSNDNDPTMIVSLLNGPAVTGGSRECILVQFPNGKNLLMDTGWASTATEVKNQILARGVTNLDYIMITHYHSDHAGGLQKWLEDGLLTTDGTGTFGVNNCIAYLPPEITTTNIGECWRIEGVDGVQALVDMQDYIIDGLTELGVTIVNPTEGQLVAVGDAAMRFWNCDHTPYSSDQGTTYKTSNYNDFSICCQIEYGSMSFNNTADIGSKAQSYMGGKLRKCVFMTGPHHGWDNNVNGLKPEFINNVNPDVVVSPNGSPHYPSPDNTSGANVLNASSPLQSWCERNNVANYMTCINGPIDITFWRHGWKFNGAYSKFIRNGKNWKWTDNSEYIEQ